MSVYRSGHDQGHDSYIDYAAHSENHRDERVYVPHVPEIQHSGTQGLNPIQEQHLGAHQPQQQQQQHPAPTPHQPQSHSVYSEHDMTHHQVQQFGGGQGMMYGPPRRMQPPTGTKRSRPEDLDLQIDSLPNPQLHSPGIQGLQSQMGQQPMVYGGQSVQAYHTHPLPNQSHRSKMPRLGDDDSISGPNAPSVVGMEGMPAPAPRPRGPKIKFTAEDDVLLVDLKENKSLTWKQIAEFFPGRTSGTLQVRYCTKLKAKTTQWTEETIHKLRTALHDYEQEKWRIVAQKVGTGFTSVACKEKAAELSEEDL